MFRGHSWGPVWMEGGTREGGREKEKGKKIWTEGLDGHSWKDNGELWERPCKGSRRKMYLKSIIHHLKR